jgi:hypothetical protein
VRPACEKPASSGLASGNGAALAALNVMPATRVVAMMSAFMISSLMGGSILGNCCAACPPGE